MKGILIESKFFHELKKLFSIKKLIMIYILKQYIYMIYFYSKGKMPE